MVTENGWFQGRAHHAMNDVDATIQLASHLKSANPEMWKYLIGYFDKNTDSERIKALPMAFTEHVDFRYGLMIHAKFGAKNVEEGKKFLKYLLTDQRMVEFSLSAHPHTIPPQKSLQSDPRLLESKVHPLGSRPDLVAINYDLENAVDFISDAGMYCDNGKVVIVNNGYNPYMGAIIAANIPSQVVQRVILNNESPKSAVEWGHAEIEKIVKEMGPA